jgi:hypothetical protein
MTEWLDLEAMIRDIQAHVQRTGDEITPYDHFVRGVYLTNPLLPGYPVKGFVATRKNCPEGESDFGGEWTIPLTYMKRDLLPPAGANEILDKVRLALTTDSEGRNLCRFLSECPDPEPESKGATESPA